MDSIFSLLTAPDAVTWVCYFIVSVAVISLLRFWFDLWIANRAASAFLGLLQQIPESPTRPAEIDFSGLAKSPISRRANLFKPYLMQILTSTGKTLRSTRPASEFFEPESVLRESVNLRLYQSVPNVLVGLGLFFTFLGLTAALTYAAEGATSSNIAEVQASLKSLLHAASFKFISSLVALLCSILFLVQERFVIRAYHRKVDRIINSLDATFPIVTSEEILQSQGTKAHLLKNAEAIVSASTVALSSAFDPALGDPRVQFQIFLQSVTELVEESREQTAVLKEFNTDLAVSVGKAIDEALSPTLKTALGSLENTVTSLGANIQSANEEVLQNMIDDFSATLRERTEESFGRMAEAGNALAATLDSNTKALRDTFSFVFESIESFSTQSSAGIKMIEATIVLLQHVAENLADTAIAMDRAGTPLASAASAAREMLEELNSMQQASNERLTSLQNLVSSMDSSLRITAETSAKNANAFKSEIESAFRVYKDGFGEIDRDLARGFNVMSEGISHTIEQVRTFITESDAGVARAILGVQGSISSLEAQLGDLDEWLADFSASVKRSDLEPTPPTAAR